MDAMGKEWEDSLKGCSDFKDGWGVKAATVG